MNIIELVGIFASICIIISMSFKTATYRGTLCMRIINIVGSAIFVVYGFLLPAYSTAILNFVLVGVNLWHTIILIKNNKHTK